MYVIFSFIAIFVLGCGSQLSVSHELHKLQLPWYFAEKTLETLKDTHNSKNTCGEQVSEYVQALRAYRKWALQMFDASGKLPSGLLEGNVDMGSFEECINTKSDTNKELIGQYCIGQIDLKSILQLQNPMFSQNGTDILNTRAMGAGGHTTLGLNQALCVPSGCSATELTYLFHKIGFTNLHISKELCQTKATQPELNASAIAFICFFAIILMIMLASTMYDSYYYYQEKDAPSLILISFSILTNVKKLLSTSQNPDVITCLHGIRVFSIVWVIIGHTYVWQVMQPIKNMTSVLQWVADLNNRFIIGATISVDTFFLISGLALSYSYLVYKRKGKNFNLILFYVHRYVRLTPAIVVVALFHLSLLKYMGSGPFWPTTVASAVEPCKKSWWKMLLYIQNYGNMEMCIAQTWYLSVDTQLYILSPIILLPLTKWPVITLIGTGVLTVLSIISCFVTSWILDINAEISANANPAKMSDFFKYYYSATHTRAAVWLIGILYGYLIYRVKNNLKLKIHKLVVVILWMVSLAVIAECVYGGHNLTIPTQIVNKLENSFYIAFVRPAWGIAVGWVIFACVSGYGGPVNWFLSLPAFEVLGKLSYCMYLVHCTVMYVKSGQIRTPLVFNNFNQMYLFWGDFAFTVIFALLLYLGIEYPIAVIEHRLLTKATCTKDQETPQTQEHQSNLKNPE